MELRSEDGSLIELSEGVEKELGRGPGFAPHDRTVSRRQVRLKVQPTAASENRFRFNVLIEVIGSNPICIIHTNGRSGPTDELEIARSGTQSLLRIGDRFSLSIQEPVLYTMQEPGARVTLGTHVSSEIRPQRNENSNGRKTLDHKQSDANNQRDGGERIKETDYLEADKRRGGIVTDPSEEEGIAEAVARWQRRKQELMDLDQRNFAQAGTVLKEDKERIGEEAVMEKQVTKHVFQLEPVQSKSLSRDSLETNEPELSDRGRPSADDTNLAKKFGFVVEGCEFERYGKRAYDTSNWVWQIGRRQVNNSDDDEDGDGGSESKQKAKPGNDDGEDDWLGEGEGEMKLLSSGKKVVSRKRGVQTRLRDVTTTSEVRSDSKKKRKISTSTPAAASTSSKKDFKRKPRASDEDDDEDGDKDSEDFVVDDVDEEEEAEDDEDELTDEDEDEDVDEDEDADEDGDGEIEELDDLAQVESRSAKNKSIQANFKPMCKYGNKCFRKNKEHLDQFRH